MIRYQPSLGEDGHIGSDGRADASQPFYKSYCAQKKREGQAGALTRVKEISEKGKNSQGG